MTVHLAWGQWVYGLFYAIISGGSSSVAATVTVSIMAPDKFNLGKQLYDTMLLMGVTFIVSAAFSGFGYLKQNPLPRWDEETERRQGDGK